MTADEIIMAAKARLVEIDKAAGALAVERDTLQRLVDAAEGRAQPPPIEVKFVPPPAPIYIPMPYPQPTHPPVIWPGTDYPWGTTITVTGAGALGGTLSVG